MGGRGASSGMDSSIGRGARELGLTSREIDRLTDTAIDFIKKQDRIYGSLTPEREKEFREQIKREYNLGFSGLEDGRILDINPNNSNIYLAKQGDKAILYRYRPTSNSTSRYFREENGVVVGYRGEAGREYELSDAQKKTYLRRAILLRLRPRRM